MSTHRTRRKATLALAAAAALLVSTMATAPASAAPAAFSTSCQWVKADKRPILSVSNYPKKTVTVTYYVFDAKGVAIWPVPPNGQVVTSLFVTSGAPFGWAQTGWSFSKPVVTVSAWATGAGNITLATASTTCTVI